MNLTLTTPLWPHQEAARLRAANRTHFGLLFEVGTGKTLAALAIYLDKCNAAGRVLPLLILSPKIVCEQWKREIGKFCPNLRDCVNVLDGSEQKRRAALWAECMPHFRSVRPIVITNHEALSTMNDLLIDLTTFGFQCLIVDECFTGETEVSTPFGPTRIDSLRRGDVVNNAFGTGVVEALIAHKSAQVMEVEFSDGTKITCTENHPFFTAEGWTQAKRLVLGAVLFSEKGLHCLLKRVRSLEIETLCDRREGVEQAKILLDILRDEIREPDARSPESSEDVEDSQENETSPVATRGQWAATSDSSNESGLSARRRMGDGTCDSHEERAWNWLSNLLQDRHSEQAAEDRDRSGRLESFDDSQEGAGPEENFVSYFPRVVGVSSIEPASPRAVFNLQVGGHPSYFANGKLVHNCQRFKSPTAKRAKRLRKLATTIKSLRLILTGTPILKGPEDLWSQMNILSPAIFPANFHSFRAVYYYDENRSWAHKPGHFPDWRPDPAKFPQLKTILDQHCSRVKKADVLTLPPLLRSEVYVDLTPEQRKHYAEMERDFVTYLRDEHDYSDLACVANIALTKLLRLQQIASGILVTEESEHRLASNKIAALKELLEDIAPNHKTIVWTCWRATYHDVEKVCTDLNLGFTTLTGDTKSRDREESIRRFQDDNDCRVCIANQGAGGVGVNLQAASCMIYLSKTHNLEHDIQSEGRAYRAGSEQHESITRIDIVTKGTIEETVTQALKDKLSFAELLLQFRGEEVRHEEAA